MFMNVKKNLLKALIKPSFYTVLRGKSRRERQFDGPQEQRTVLIHIIIIMLMLLTMGRYCVMQRSVISEISVPLRTNLFRFFNLVFLSNKPNNKYLFVHQKSNNQTFNACFLPSNNHCEFSTSPQNSNGYCVPKKERLHSDFLKFFYAKKKTIILLYFQKYTLKMN